MREMIKIPNFSLAVYARGDKNSDKIALVLPGLLDTKDYPHMISHVDFLATKGYLALSFDPPGTWESDGGIDSYTMTNYLRAIDEVIDHFGNKQTFVMGHSLGGCMAMFSAINNPCVFAFAGVMSAPSFVRINNYEERVVRWKAEGIKTSYRDMPNNPTVKKQFDLNYSFSEDAQQYDAHEGLSLLTKPKLLIAGDQDITVDLKLVQETYDVSAQPKSMHVLKSDHDYRWHPKLINEVNEYVDEFLSTL